MTGARIRGRFYWVRPFPKHRHGGRGSRMEPSESSNTGAGANSMKFLGTVWATFLTEQGLRRNMLALVRLTLLLVVVIAVFAIGFHVIMANVEGQRHSWFTGVYWTLTVMSTLGFGDITFSSDLGKAFSMVVLMTGMILLLIVLPFAFIRSFYAPWLEAQLRLRAPRTIPEGTMGHVILTRADSIAAGLFSRLESARVPYFVLEPDPTVAAHMHSDGISVICSPVDGSGAYSGLQVRDARLVVANHDDIANTNITISIREVAPHVPIAAFAENPDSVDILELAGADHVLMLKQQLGEQLASRANPGHVEAHVLGHFKDLLITEFPVRRTPLVGKTIAESGLRETSGVNVIGLWDRARMTPASGHSLLTDRSVAVVVGTQQQIDDLNTYLYRFDPNPSPVLVIGGGKVGRAAAVALKQRGAGVHMIEKKIELKDRIGDKPDRLFIGDANSRTLIEEAGLMEAPAVLLTASDDAVNIYLTVYARRLRPDILIVSRLTHERNVEAIQRAGADLAISYSTLGVEALLSLVQERDSVVFGEGVELLDVLVPRALVGLTLAEAQIWERTQLKVIAVQEPGRLITNPGASTRFVEGSELVMVGDQDRLKKFHDAFGQT